MTEPNLDSDIAEARQELEPLVMSLQGLLQMWHMFQSAKLVSREFHSKFDNLSYQLKIACTRSFVVDYLKPWSGNFSSEINSLKVFESKKKWSYPFLDEIVKTDEYSQLVELRNSSVAHLDQDYEGGGISLKGIKVENNPTRGKQEGTLDNVFLPAAPVISGIRGLWWLSNKNKVEELCTHIEEAIKLVEAEIRETGGQFRDKCLDHMHVLDQLEGLFGVVEIPLIEGSASVTSHAEDPRPLSSDNPRALSIGEQNIQSLVTVYEPQKEYPTEQEFLGKGYKLTIGTMSEEGQLQFNVSFPEYPFPKEPVN
ncbi:MAG: hypothetical protein V7742_21630 [Halioglobus sp.]